MAGITYPVRLKSIEDYIRLINGAPRQMVKSERDILDDYAGQILADIENAWPVDTSTSRDAWTYTVIGRADWMGFILDNDVDYAEFVHYAGAPASPALWETLLPATVATYAPGLLAALRTEAAATQPRIADNQRQGGRGLLAVLQRVIRPATAAFKVGP